MVVASKAAHFKLSSTILVSSSAKLYDSYANRSICVVYIRPILSRCLGSGLLGIGNRRCHSGGILLASKTNHTIFS
ncbi:MAG: hypothetical protein ACE5HI_16075, partial [bacterium]